MTYHRSLQRYSPALIFIYLLNPFWNHCFSLQSNWLSVVRFIHESHLFCSKSHLFLSQWEWDSKTKQPIRFQGSIKVINKISGKWKAKGHCLENFATAIAKTLLLLQVFFPKLVRFQNGCNKVAIELRVVQFWSEIIPVISNHANDFRPNCTPLSSITIINTRKCNPNWAH